MNLRGGPNARRLRSRGGNPVYSPPYRSRCSVRIDVPTERLSYDPNNHISPSVCMHMRVNWRLSYHTKGATKIIPFWRPLNIPGQLRPKFLFAPLRIVDDRVSPLFSGLSTRRTVGKKNHDREVITRVHGFQVARSTAGEMRARLGSSYNRSFLCEREPEKSTENPRSPSAFRDSNGHKTDEGRKRPTHCYRQKDKSCSVSDKITYSPESTGKMDVGRRLFR